MMEHALRDGHDIAGIDDPPSAEHPALQDAHREIMGGSPSSIHVELIVHASIALSEIGTDEIAPLFEHDDLVSGLCQEACGRRSTTAGSDDADLRRDRLGRRLLRQVYDRAGHGVTVLDRFIDGPG
jgi:hypothetical protein